MTAIDGRISFKFDSFDESQCNIKLKPSNTEENIINILCSNNKQQGEDDNTSSEQTVTSAIDLSKIASNDWETTDETFDRVVWIADIPLKYQNVSSLYDIFNKFGKIEKIKLILNKNDIARGWIMFSNKESSQLCASIMNETELLSHTLQVFIGKPPSVVLNLRLLREEQRKQRQLEILKQRQQNKQQKQKQKQQSMYHYNTHPSISMSSSSMMTATPMNYHAMAPPHGHGHGHGHGHHSMIIPHRYIPPAAAPAAAAAASRGRGYYTHNNGYSYGSGGYGRGSLHNEYVESNNNNHSNMTGTNSFGAARGRGGYGPTRRSHMY